MKKLIAITFALSLFGCTVNPSKLDASYAKEFADSVRCAWSTQQVGEGVCWCFVASRKTGSTDSTGIGLTLAPKELCKR